MDRGIDVDHDLDEAGVIAQHEKEEPAEVPLAVDPAGDLDRLSLVLAADFAATVGAIPIWSKHESFQCAPFHGVVPSLASRIPPPETAPSQTPTRERSAGSSAEATTVTEAGRKSKPCSR
jgi:hypothetical protein